MAPRCYARSATRTARSRACAARARSVTRLTAERMQRRPETMGGANNVPTALVIGADKGIAWEVAIQLAQRGDTVYAALLGADADFGAAPVHKIPHVDVTSGAALARMVHGLQAAHAAIDTLYHIA